MYFISASKIGFTTGAVSKLVIDGNKTGVGLDGNMLYYFNGAILNPVGMITDFGGSTAPTGWLLCDGSNYTRLSYPELFTVISTNFGSGNGSTTAGLPDLRGRVTVGKDNMGGSTAGRITNAGCGIVGTTLGASGATETHTMVLAELAPHTHSFSASSSTGFTNLDHTHVGGTLTATVVSSGTGTLGVINGSSPTSFGLGSTAGYITTNYALQSAGDLGWSGATGVATPLATAQNHQHTFTASGTTGTLSAATAFSVVQPSMITNKIIFAGRP